MQILVITYGDDTKEIDLNSVSNSELKPEDFEAFVDERAHHGEKLMTKNVSLLSFTHSKECKKRCDHMKELETKTPTEKDMMNLLARRLLEDSDLGVDLIADRAGFGSAATLRHHFAQRLATTPQAYRATFRTRAA